METSARGGDLKLIAILAAVLLALGLTPLALSLPKVASVPAPGDFDTNRAVARLARVLGDERPHSVDTDANDAVRARLLEEIKAMGYAPEVRDDFTCVTKAKWGRTACARVRNIVFRAGPQDGKAVMLAAHYDSVPAGPGAADDGLGVAASLEVAKHFADAPPAKPLLFLLTDGEEMGLLGAHSFVRTDPLADQVKAVVNVEARGDKGPGVMFQTSQPNSVDIAAFAKAARRPFSNSMMTDIYRLLPNDTDVTEFLPKHYDALNIALVDGLSHYHTPLDNLANLDQRSLQHTGRQTLGAVEALLNEKAAPEHQVIFTDILSRFLLVMPQWAGGLILLFGLAAAGFSCWRAGGGRPFRAIVSPPAILIIAGLVCWLLQKLVGAVRPEALYWYAHPEAIAFVAYLSAAFAAAVSLKFIAGGAGRERVLASAWFWFAAAGGAIWFVAPGASILFAPGLCFYILSVVADRIVPQAKTPLAATAALLVLIVMAPALVMAGITLGGGAAPVFAVVAGLVMMVAAPLALDEEIGLRAFPVALAGAALFVACGAALSVPAYSKANPGPLNINYVVDAETRIAQWALYGPAGEPAPEALAALAPFEPAEIAGLGSHVLAAPADFAETPAQEIEVVSDGESGEGRKVRVRLIANGADIISLQIPEAAGAVSYEAGSEKTDFAASGAQRIYCIGRACDGAEFSFTLKTREPQDWRVFGLRFGLPASAGKFVKARPDNATPIQTGDAAIVRTRIKI